MLPLSRRAKADAVGSWWMICMIPMKAGTSLAVAVPNCGVQRVSAGFITTGPAMSSALLKTGLGFFPILRLEAFGLLQHREAFEHGRFVGQDDNAVPVRAGESFHVIQAAPDGDCDVLVAALGLHGPADVDDHDPALCLQHGDAVLHHHLLPVLLPAGLDPVPRDPDDQAPSTTASNPSEPGSS